MFKRRASSGLIFDQLDGWIINPTEIDAAMHAQIDEHYPAAVAVVAEAGYASFVLLIRKIGIRLELASCLLWTMQETGIVGDYDDETRSWDVIERRGFY